MCSSSFMSMLTHTNVCAHMYCGHAHRCMYKGQYTLSMHTPRCAHTLMHVLVNSHISQVHPSRPRRGIASPLAIRRGEGAQGSGAGTSVFPSGEPGVSGDFWVSQEGCQGPFHPSGRNRGLPLRRRGGQGPHLAKRWEPCDFSRVAAAFSSYDWDLSLPLGLALGSPIFPSGCEGKRGDALESLQGRRDLT